jgi:capsular polysaccharide biosynthesis protein
VVGFAAGLAAIGATMIYLLIFRVSIITTESLERTLGVRVLGAIPDVA